MDDPNELMTVQACAERYAVRKGTVYRAVSKGKVRLALDRGRNGVWLIARTEWERYRRERKLGRPKKETTK